MSPPALLSLVATCSLGLEELLAAEIRQLAPADLEDRPSTQPVGPPGPEGSVRTGRGAVHFSGSWEDCWQANWRLRTANRVLVELATWEGRDGAELAAGARALAAGRLPSHLGASGAGFTAGGEGSAADLLHPDRTFAIQATTTASVVSDARWAALSVKDGLVDGQRERWGRRSDVDRTTPDLHLRLRLHEDRATLLLDTTGEPLDRRGYRVVSGAAPVREQLAAACVLASEWDGAGAVVDPMCGSGTLLVEAAWIALGVPPGSLREGWAFERLPGFSPERFAAIRAAPLPAPGPDVRLIANDNSPEALRAARANLERAGLSDRTRFSRADAFSFTLPDSAALSPGLVVVNPPHGERAAAGPERWRALGDLLKSRFRGWRAVVLAGGADRGKHIGLRPRRRWPVMNGQLEARILVFDLY